MDDRLIRFVEKQSGREKTRVLAQLRQSIWEASQWLTASEISIYVDKVIQEVETDEP